jgi:hypothetical protein
MHANSYVHRPRILQIHLKPLSQKMESASLQLERASQSRRIQDFLFDSLDGGLSIIESSRVVSTDDLHQGSPSGQIHKSQFSSCRSRWRNLWETGSRDRPAGTIYCLLTLTQALVDGSSAWGPRVGRIDCLTLPCNELEGSLLGGVWLR